jgi:N-methylhydantoinase A
VAFPLEAEDPVAAASAAFHDAHEKRYTYRLDTPVQLVNFHLVATVPVDKPEIAPRVVTGAVLADAVRGTRTVDFDQHGTHESTIYDGLRLEPGMEFVGPAVIQEPSVTLPVPPGRTVRIDDFGNYHVHVLGLRNLRCSRTRSPGKSSRTRWWPWAKRCFRR